MKRRFLAVILVLTMLTGMTFVVSADEPATVTVTYSTIVPVTNAVTLSTNYTGGTIRYTLDGTSPTADSTAVSGAVSIPTGTYRLTSAVFDASGNKVSADFCHTYVNGTLTNKALQTEKTKHTYTYTPTNGREPYNAFDGNDMNTQPAKTWGYGTYMNTVTYDTAFTADTLVLTLGANTRFLNAAKTETVYDIYAEVIVGYKELGTEESFVYVIGDASGSNRTYEKILVPAGSAVTEKNVSGTKYYFVNTPAVEVETANGEPITAKVLEVRLSKAELYTAADKPTGVNANDYKGGIFHIKEMWFLDSAKPVPKVYYSTAKPDATEVTLTTNYLGGTIRYTLDGKSPTATSTEATTAITIPDGTTRLTSAVFNANDTKLSEDFCNTYVNGTPTNKAITTEQNTTGASSECYPWKAFDGDESTEWTVDTTNSAQLSFDTPFETDTMMIAGVVTPEFIDTQTQKTKYDVFVEALVGYKETGLETDFTYVIGENNSGTKAYEKILIPAGADVVGGCIKLPAVKLGNNAVTVKALYVELYQDKTDSPVLNKNKGGIGQVREMYFLEAGVKINSPSFVKNDTLTMTVSGYIRSKAGESVQWELYNANNDKVLFGSDNIDSNGDITIVTVLPRVSPSIITGGSYTYKLIFEDGRVITSTIDIPNHNDKLNIMEYIRDNELTDEQIQSKLAETNLCVDETLLETVYPLITKDFMAGELLKLKEQNSYPANITDFADKVNEYTVLSVFNQNLSAYVEPVLEAYMSQIAVSDTEKTYYNADLSDTGVSNVIDNMAGQSFSSYADAKKRFETLVNTNYLTNSNIDTTGDKESIIRDASNKLGFTIENITDHLIVTLVDSGAATPEALEYIYKNYKPPVINTEEPRNDTFVSSGPSGVGSYIPATKPAETTSPSDSTFFSDMTSCEWAIKAVNYLRKEGIIYGKTDSEYYPMDNVKREEAVAMLVRMFPNVVADADISYTDVDADMWCYPAIRLAVGGGLISGISEDLMGIGLNVTRQDILTMLLRAIISEGEIDVYNIGNEKVFTDFDEVSEYAKEAVRVLSALEIVSGYEDGTIRGGNVITRAEIAQMLYNVAMLRKG